MGKAKAKGGILLGKVVCVKIIFGCMFFRIFICPNLLSDGSFFGFFKPVISFTPYLG